MFGRAIISVYKKYHYFYFPKKIFRYFLDFIQPFMTLKVLLLLRHVNPDSCLSHYVILNHYLNINIHLIYYMHIISAAYYIIKCKLTLWKAQMIRDSSVLNPSHLLYTALLF